MNQESQPAPAVKCPVRKVALGLDLWALKDADGRGFGNIITESAADAIVAALNERNALLADRARWLIWSFEHRGWWMPNENGYTRERKNAGRYSYADALRIVAEANQHSEILQEAMEPDHAARSSDAGAKEGA